MSQVQYCQLQCELIKRYCKRTGRSELEWVKKYAFRFSKHFRKFLI